MRGLGLTETEKAMYESEFNRQLQEKTKELEKIQELPIWENASRVFTAWRHAVDAWWPRAVSLYLSEPKRSQVYGMFSIITPQIRTYTDVGRWEEGLKYAYGELKVMSGLLKAPSVSPIPPPAVPDPAPNAGDVPTPKPPSAFKKIPWGWITAGGVTALAVGFALPRLKK